MIKHFSAVKKINIRVFLIFFIGFLLSFALVLSYSMYRNRVVVTDLSEYITGGTGQFAYGIDEVRREGGRTYISGWAIETGKLYEYYNFGRNLEGEGVYNHNQIALVDGNNVYLLYSSSVKRDVGKETDGQIDYKQCGVQARLKSSALQGKEYTIAIVLQRPDGEKYLLLTDQTWKA